MKLYFDNTNIDLILTDQSNRTRTLMGDDSLTLHFQLPYDQHGEYIDIPVGAWCYYPEGTEIKYTLEKPQNFKKNHSRDFEYTLILEGEQAKLKRYKFRDIGSRKLKFSLTAKPEEHLKMLIDNLNKRDTGWKVGNKCVDAAEKTLSYNHTTCLDALNMMAQEFNTEWEIKDKTIYLCKVEHYKENPLALSYGRGNGLVGGMDRSNISDSKAVETLFVQGGSQNIDLSRYNSPELLLPKNQQIGYDGTYFEDESGYNASEARIYKTDADGYSIQRADKPLKTHIEDSLDLSHIYPSRTGEVTRIDAGFPYDFWDKTIPEDLDYSKHRIDGEKISVVFQTGILAGKTFDITQTETEVTGYVHKDPTSNKALDRRFKLVPQDIDGRSMPDSLFKPAIGDKYAVFGMMMPDQYIENSEKGGAAWDMFREAVRYMYDHENPRFSFRAELDGIWAKENWRKVGDKVIVGGYVEFSDPQFQPESVPIRIVSVKEFINNPHSPTIELSNSPLAQSVSSSLGKIEENEVVVENNRNEAHSYNKRYYQSAKELIGMLEGAVGNFSESINPVSVHAMSLLLGADEYQFGFTDGMSPLERFQCNSGAFIAKAGPIQHYTIPALNALGKPGEKVMASKNNAANYRKWTIQNNLERNNLKETPTTPYFLYIECPSGAGTTGKYRLEKDALPFVDGSNYNLLVGILSSEINGERDFVSMHGFTEILPGRITTDKIVSNDGSTYFDLTQNKIAGKINFLDGLISGRVEVGNDDTINCGISGVPKEKEEDPSPIRFWAGDADENKAPFKVWDDGSMESTKGKIGAMEVDEGELIMYNSIREPRITITPGNITSLDDIDTPIDDWKYLNSASSISEFGPDGLNGTGNCTIKTGNTITLPKFATFLLSGVKIKSIITTRPGNPNIPKVGYMTTTLILKDEKRGTEYSICRTECQANIDQTQTPNLYEMKETFSLPLRDGTYSLYLQCNYYGNELSYFEVNMNGGMMRYNYTINETVIGMNGIITAWGSDNHFYAAKVNNQFKIQARSGKAAIRLEDGLIRMYGIGFFNANDPEGTIYREGDVLKIKLK